MGELDRRLSQFSADIEREQRLSSDADVALTRLDAEDAALKDEIKAKVELRSGADTRVAEAEATLAEAEKVFSELTTALAALTAQRNSLEANVRTHQRSRRPARSGDRQCRGRGRSRSPRRRMPSAI